MAIPPIFLVFIMVFHPIPEGEPREIKTFGSASIDGAPIAYIVVLSAIVTTLAFIPFSILLSSGGSMPLSQALFPLLGWILGPIAGATASGIGTLIGIFLAPYTAGLPALSIWGAVVASFTAGTMVLGKKRSLWWFWLTIISVLQLYLYANRAIAQNGIAPKIFIAGAFVDWSGVLLLALPTRILFARWINSKELRLLTLGLFFGSWMVSGLSHLSQVVISYFMFNWPEEVWITLIPVMPFENLIRSVVGTIIGIGVISGLRAIGLVKAREAIY
jgi:hypothetical protein